MKPRRKLKLPYQYSCRATVVVAVVAAVVAVAAVVVAMSSCC